MSCLFQDLYSITIDGVKNLDKIKKLNSKKRIKKWGSKIYVFFRTIILCGICYYVLFPILQSFFQTFMAHEDLYDSTVDLIPKNWTLANLEIMFKSVNIPIVTITTLGICLLVTVAQLCSCTLVGYGFARFNFPGKNILFMLVIFTLVVPPQTIITPLYLNFRNFAGTGLNLLNTIAPFAILGFTAMGLKNGLYVFMVRQFYRNVPKELEEAAMIDGAGFFRTFISVMLPSAKPILSVVAIFSLVWQWTDTFYNGWFAPNIKVLSSQILAVPTNLSVIQKFLGVSVIEDGYEHLLNGTGALIIMLPLIIFYIFTQRAFVESIERGGIVG